MRRTLLLIGGKLEGEIGEKGGEFNEPRSCAVGGVSLGADG